MPVRVWQVQQPLNQLRREVDRLVSGFLGGLPDGISWSGARGQPAVNAWETAEAVHLEMEVPGVKADQIDISVVGPQVAIRVARPEPEGEGVTYHRRERPVGEFTRMFKLPVEVDADKVEAELRNGVLTIRLPKAEAARPRKIQVKGAQ